MKTVADLQLLICASQDVDVIIFVLSPEICRRRTSCSMLN